MKTVYLPYLALGLGLFLLAVVILGSQPVAEGQSVLPLLTRLVISEFGFFLTAIGAWIGVRHALVEAPRPFYLVATGGCVLLALGFATWGIRLWPT
ncbi:MAG: hypothetical protein U5S82_21165 [Gammaproteobacteria bacterium]|nr:hypothetical protein [Gammaproteobacteria bacterium]